MSFRNKLFLGILIIFLLSSCTEKNKQESIAKDDRPNIVLIMSDDMVSGPAEQLETKEGYVLSYGRAWANASNTPYREYKHFLHEGGMATPFIVHWSKGIPTEKRGETIREYGFLPDLMATSVDLAETTYPKTYKGNDIVPTSGKSLRPLFQEAPKRIHTEPIFWEHEGNKAVRLGKYKLVQKWEKDVEDNWELYDMEKDRTETDDLM